MQQNEDIYPNKPIARFIYNFRFIFLIIYLPIFFGTIFTMVLISEMATPAKKNALSSGDSSAIVRNNENKVLGIQSTATTIPFSLAEDTIVPNTVIPVMDTPIPTNTPVPTFTPVPTATPMPTPTKTPFPTYDICAGHTAICGDGTISNSAHRQGTCSHHGGVARWC